MNKKRFKNWAILTIVSVYILIFIGGIVRSTGSGMGCPDWPKCFGEWVPPSNIRQLPKNYREIYSDKRKIKNAKLASFCDRLGFHELSSKIRNDPRIYKEEVFNPLKTVIEYLNRIIGVLIGFFIFLTFLFSFAYWNSDKSIIFYSLASLILVGVEGWIGSIVVSTNLLPGTTTVHMLLALMIVFLLILSVIKSDGDRISYPVIYINQPLVYFLLVCLIISVVQIIIGTQVREMIDVISSRLGENKRPYWINHIGNIFITHRSFSWIILITNACLYVYVKKLKQKLLNTFSNFLLTIIFLEIFTGIIMNYFNIPSFIQPIHLLLASLIFGIQSILLLSLLPNLKFINNKS